jgi:hypothetical protein
MLLAASVFDPLRRVRVALGALHRSRLRRRRRAAPLGPFSAGLVFRLRERLQCRFRNAIENAQQHLDGGIGFVLAALPAPDDAYRDCQSPGELQLTEPQLSAHGANRQQRRQGLGRRREVRIFGDQPVDRGIGKAVEFLRVTFGLFPA